MQVIDPGFATIPDTCKNTGIPEDDTLSTLGANGILGIGPFAEDCGTACEQTGSANPGLYFECPSNSCQVAAEPLNKQVQNPVPLFPKDNNGVIVQLPSLTAAAGSLTGSLVFGIGTQSNNGLGGAKIFTLDINGEFTTTFQGKSYPAFVDSGSNALFFLDSSVSGLAVCSDNSGFYCPASTANLTATTSSGSLNTKIDFSI